MFDGIEDSFSYWDWRDRHMGLSLIIPLYGGVSLSDGVVPWDCEDRHMGLSLQWIG